MGRPIYLNKTLGAASSNLLGTISTAASPVVTINTSGQPLDTARRIAIQSSIALSSGISFNVTGTIEGGGIKTETIFSSTGAALTTLDFLTVTSVSVSSQPGTPLVIGTVSVGGTRWVVADPLSDGPIAGQVTFSSSANAVTANLEWTLDDPTNTWPITRLGQPFPQPSVNVSTAFTAVNAVTNGIVNAEANQWIPIYAYRMTLTSTSTSTTVFATILEGKNG